MSGSFATALKHTSQPPAPWTGPPLDWTGLSAAADDEEEGGGGGDGGGGATFAQRRTRATTHAAKEAATEDVYACPSCDFQNLYLGNDFALGNICCHRILCGGSMKQAGCKQWFCLECGGKLNGSDTGHLRCGEIWKKKMSLRARQPARRVTWKERVENRELLA
jgi:hypothetical protein